MLLAAFHVGIEKAIADGIESQVENWIRSYGTPSEWDSSVTELLSTFFSYEVSEIGDYLYDAFFPFIKHTYGIDVESIRSDDDDIDWCDQAMEILEEIID